MLIANIGPTSYITLGQVVKHILGTGKITRADEMFFQRAMVTDVTLSHEEMQQVAKIYDRLQMGLLKVVD